LFVETCDEGGRVEMGAFLAGAQAIRKSRRANANFLGAFISE
jgi:hypothetical protein